MIDATEKFPGGGGIWSPGMDLWRGIWTAFWPWEGGIWTKNFPKIQMPGVCPGGEFVEASIWLVHNPHQPSDKACYNKQYKEDQSLVGRA